MFSFIFCINFLYDQNHSKFEIHFIFIYYESRHISISIKKLYLNVFKTINTLLKRNILFVFNSSWKEFCSTSKVTQMRQSVSQFQIVSNKKS